MPPSQRPGPPQGPPADRSQPPASRGSGHPAAQLALLGPLPPLLLELGPPPVDVARGGQHRAQVDLDRVQGLALPLDPGQRFPAQGLQRPWVRARCTSRYCRSTSSERPTAAQRMAGARRAGSTVRSVHELVSASAAAVSQSCQARSSLGCTRSRGRLSAERCQVCGSPVSSAATRPPSSAPPTAAEQEEQQCDRRARPVPGRPDPASHDADQKDHRPDRRAQVDGALGSTQGRDRPAGSTTTYHPRPSPGRSPGR